LILSPSTTEVIRAEIPSARLSGVASGRGSETPALVHGQGRAGDAISVPVEAVGVARRASERRVVALSAGLGREVLAVTVGHLSGRVIGAGGPDKDHGR
jgi:hypothetical protein